MGADLKSSHVDGDVGREENGGNVASELKREKKEFVKNSKDRRNKTDFVSKVWKKARLLVSAFHGRLAERSL